MEKVTIESIKKIVIKLKQDARGKGLEFVDITSRDVHDLIGGYPNGNSRFPSCCKAMYAVMTEDDKVLDAPKSLLSSTVKVRYYL
ncbi:hypothetical protein AEA09_07310 [Lysinibacillus contaminans]|uniref:Uncharacterized protein n=1 Tax=Lysinibacillus contaminans TaxID=1293441 RepID=A0ABR5K0W5_9BACI|nr:hypothetical protein [Lysinibacillus contaminans]KOS68382.1 hypothetical protein AEA09_07310 [Lysinibacillus contaminans]